jgi:hypothetical protein
VRKEVSFQLIYVYIEFYDDEAARVTVADGDDDSF